MRYAWPITVNEPPHLLAFRKLRELTLTAPVAPGRPRHLSAASGLVAVQSFLYVAADDEHHLGVFPVSGSAPGALIRLLDGDLPDNKEERKQLKPDLEALVLLPPFSSVACGALFAIGSGSTANRNRGFVLPLDRLGAVVGKPRSIDLLPLFTPIRERVGDLNIEGAVILADRLHLLQRGNKGGGINALITLMLPQVLLALAAGDVIGEMPFDCRRYELGSVDGVPLGFTDGAGLRDGRIVFTAVAEDTNSSYLDGLCLGAAVGILAADGELQRLEPFNLAAKVEGVDAHLEGDRIRLLLVTDADDARVPALLCAAEIDR